MAWFIVVFSPPNNVQTYSFNSLPYASQEFARLLGIYNYERAGTIIMVEVSPETGPREVLRQVK